MVMSLSACQILYAYVIERDTLDPVYASFLIKFGGKDARLLDACGAGRRPGIVLLRLFLNVALFHMLGVCACGRRHASAQWSHHMGPRKSTERCNGYPV